MTRTATALFPLRSILLLSVTMMVFMLLIPFAEAAEQTVLQRVVPFERQGRVFGFAQRVEQAAFPLTAFLVAPATQLWVIPSMTDGAGARAIGDWFGTGPTGASRSSSSSPEPVCAQCRQMSRPPASAHDWRFCAAAELPRHDRLEPGVRRQERCVDGPHGRRRPGQLELGPQQPLVLRPPCSGE